MALAVTIPDRNSTAAGSKVNVLVADDSAVVRGLIVRMLESDPTLRVVTTASDGARTIAELARHPEVDVIVLDVEMPVMDGLTAISKLLALDPNVRIIMASTLTQRNAEISMRALESGAADYVPKPSTRELSGAATFRDELIRKVRELGTARRRRRGFQPASTPVARTPVREERPTSRPQSSLPTHHAAGKGTISLRPVGREAPAIVAIGSSTGGPQALMQVFQKLPLGSVKLPIVITQHMPPTFTALLAEHLSRQSGWHCEQANDGDVVEPGRVLLAPGDRHMLIQADGTRKIIRLTQDPPVNFCRPAVDPMLNSIVRVYGPRALAVILTGMGSDGCRGCGTVVEAGGTVIAQDEETSVVWGMPGAVANAGYCSAVLPIGEIAASIQRLTSRG